MGFLHRTGIMEEAVYSNTDSSDTYLVEGKEFYIGVRIIFMRETSYNHWGQFEKCLLSG
jgi:hypothetical protein